MTTLNNIVCPARYPEFGGVLHGSLPSLQLPPQLIESGGGCGGSYFPVVGGGVHPFGHHGFVSFFRIGIGESFAS